MTTRNGGDPGVKSRTHGSADLRPDALSLPARAMAIDLVPDRTTSLSTVRRAACC
jgi:hypothetical protein